MSNAVLTLNPESLSNIDQAVGFHSSPRARDGRYRSHGLWGTWPQQSKAACAHSQYYPSVTIDGNKLTDKFLAGLQIQELRHLAIGTVCHHWDRNPLNKNTEAGKLIGLVFRRRGKCQLETLRVPMHNVTKLALSFSTSVKSLAMLYSNMPELR